MDMEGKESPVVMAEQYGRDDMVALLVQLGTKNMVETRDNGVKITMGKHFMTIHEFASGVLGNT